MIAISFRFLAGRFHATPWGRHVNEGAVEWPPSPWRILRALVATWKRTLPDITESDVKPVLEALAVAPPEFVLPPASTGHTRHYMPWDKGWKHDKQHPRTLVFDTFVAVPRDATLIVRWLNASFENTQRTTLARILANLNTLGRSESWCEAVLLDGDETRACLDQSPERERRVSAPLNGNDPHGDAEIVRLLCPDSNDAFADVYVITVTTKTTGRGKNKQTTIYDPAWNLCIETLQLHQERWSDPPGSRWVQYARPRDCFKIDPAVQPRTRSPTRPCIQVVRYAFDSTVLPLVTETLPVAESARRHVMGIYGRLTEQNDVRGRSAVFSGKDEDGSPLSGHVHAFYLPTDEDGDGRLDHLTLFARDGFGPDERRALDRLREIKPRGRDNASHPLRVLLLGMGTLKEYQPGPLRTSKVWVSATPYLVTRHAKTRGRDRIDMSSPQARAEFLVADLRGQLRAAPADSSGNADDVKIESVYDSGAYKIAGRWRQIQFKRFRSKPGDDGGRRLAGAFRMEFPSEIPGPVALGHAAHFGLGLFVPHPSDRMRST